ncbi:MAG: nucleotide exchange factor GrpE [Actinomycetota bacterium]|jgi:molecular chaperone GrpE
MSEENLHHEDPQHHEGDPVSEMTEEGSPVEPESASDEKDAVDRELEIFQDLQRLQADFVNYRARVERDRGAERQAAIAEAIRAFLPALDDLTRAEAHGDLQEGTPMAAIATKLKVAGEKFGLKSFGAKGDRFDPEHHDALVQTPNPEVSEAVIADVVELGYQIGDRMLRPAKVAVFVPAE